MSLTKSLARFAMNAMLPRPDLAGPDERDVHHRQGHTHDQLKGLADTDVDGFLDRLLDEAPPVYKIGLVGGALFLLATPPLTIRAFKPANALRPDQLDAHVNALATHDIYLVRQVTFAVKMMAGLCWGADPGVRTSVGLEPLDPDPGTWREGDA